MAIFIRIDLPYYRQCYFFWLVLPIPMCAGAVKKGFQNEHFDRAQSDRPTERRSSFFLVYQNIENPFISCVQQRKVAKENNGNNNDDVLKDVGGVPSKSNAKSAQRETMHRGYFWVKTNRDA
jgi:hypothetical protein